MPPNWNQGEVYSRLSNKVLTSTPQKELPAAPVTTASRTLKIKTKSRTSEEKTKEDPKEESLQLVRKVAKVCQPNQT